MSTPNDAQPEIARSFQVQTLASVLRSLEETCEGMLMVDEHANITWIDEKYKALLGVTDEVIGKVVEDVIPNSLMRRVVETRKPILLDLMDFYGRTYVVVRFPLKEPDGTVKGAIGIVLFDRFQYLQPIMTKFSVLQHELLDAQRQLAGERQAKYRFSQLVGTSAIMRETKRTARRAAQLDSTVLLLGETGTGKELLAHAIHATSMRADKPFVAVNLAAVPETLLEAEFFGVAPGAYTGADRHHRDGKFVVAEGGTLFLDEVGDMPPALQGKLLRALQEREIEPLGSNKVTKVNVRIIAATSQEMETLVQKRAFRADLYYRLNVVPITLPSLRQHPEDIQDIAEALLERVALRTNTLQRELTPLAIQALAAHRWPGNVRELANVLERMTALTDAQVLTAEDVTQVVPRALVPTPSPAAPVATSPEVVGTLRQILAETERIALVDALRRSHGSKSNAARLLGITRSNLYDKLHAHGMELDG